MGGVNVKITIVERVMQIVAPHPCSGCAKVGTLLCHDCKNDIIEERFSGCILCEAPQMSGICPRHHSPIARAFTVGARTGTLETLINRYKFEHTRGAVFPLANLFDETLPRLPSTVEIVPIPTVRSHVRERGYDHVALLAQQLGLLRGPSIIRALQRTNNKTQHIANKVERRRQAENAFTLAISPAEINGKTLLLLDDIVTTGATLQAAASVLQKAGATVWVATLAYQPLD